MAGDDNSFFTRTYQYSTIIERKRNNLGTWNGAVCDDLNKPDVANVSKNPVVLLRDVRV